MPIPDNHLSASRVNTFMRCGMQYYFRYIDGLISPPSGALALGSSFHGTIGWDHAQKVETGANMPLDSYLDHFSDDWQERKHEVCWWEGEKEGAFKDQGYGLLEAYYKEIALEVQPASVERKFEIEFANKDWSFVGYIDLVDEDDVIVEAKTIKSTPPRPKADHMLQTVGYTTGYRSEGHVELESRIDYAVKLKKPKIVSYPFKVSDSEIDFFLGQVARVAMMIENEMFLNSRHLSPFPCSHKFCGYSSRCEQVLGGIVPER